MNTLTWNVIWRQTRIDRSIYSKGGDSTTSPGAVTVVAVANLTQLMVTGLDAHPRNVLQWLNLNQFKDGINEFRMELNEITHTDCVHSGQRFGLYPFFFTCARARNYTWQLYETPWLHRIFSTMATPYLFYHAYTVSFPPWLHHIFSTIVIPYLFHHCMCI